MSRDKLALLLPILVPAIFLGTILAIMLLPAAKADSATDTPDHLARNLAEAVSIYEVDAP